jgi:hypothetical protein
MRKIKNFRINLRIKEILRVIKKFLNAVELSVEFEAVVRRCCHFYSRFLIPSAIYKAFSKETLPFVCEKDVPLKNGLPEVFFL